MMFGDGCAQPPILEQTPGNFGSIGIEVEHLAEAFDDIAEGSDVGELNGRE